MRTSIRVAVTVLVTALVPLTACTAPTPSGPNPATCPAAAAGQIRVVVVVDATTLPVGAAPAPSVTCVLLPAGSDGLDALNARAAKLGTTAPRLAGGGLLCGIDGLPAAPACGDLGPNGYEYWGYFVGGAAWDFATVGPASRVLVDGDVEGWSFQPGDNGGPPATLSSFALLAA